MHDLGYFREHLDEFEQMAANRGVEIDFDGFRALDQERREQITAVERLKAQRNKASEEIARRKKAGEDASALLAEMKRQSRTKSNRPTTAPPPRMDAKLVDFMLTVPNRPHRSVPQWGILTLPQMSKCAAGSTRPKFEFTAAPALGNRGRRRDHRLRARHKNVPRDSRYTAASARAWNVPWPAFFSIRTRPMDILGEILPPSSS